MNYGNILRFAERISTETEQAITNACLAPAEEQQLAIEVIKAIADTFDLNEEFGL